MPAPDASWMPWLDRFGFPVALLVLLAVMTYFALRAIFKWAVPHVDKMIEAHVKRQESVAESMKKLVDKTIEMQENNANSIGEIVKEIPKLCKWTTHTK